MSKLHIIINYTIYTYRRIGIKWLITAEKIARRCHNIIVDHNLERSGELGHRFGQFNCRVCRRSRCSVWGYFSVEFRKINYFYDGDIYILKYP